jgi:hypothetical protein
LQKKIRAASDGSLDLDEELASFGWHLIGKGNVLVKGAGPVDGVPDTLSLTRVELFSIAAIDEFLHHFCTFHNITSTSHVIKCCDNKAAIASVPDTLSLMQVELFSIAAIDQFLHHFCTFHNITSTSHVIKCCDNKAAIARVN